MVLTQSETPTKKLISLTCRISDSQVLSSSIKLSKYSNNWASFPMFMVVTFTVTSRRRLLAEPPGDVLPHPVTIASRSRENIWNRKVISQAMSNVSNVTNKLFKLVGDIYCLHDFAIFSILRGDPSFFCIEVCFT